MLTEAERNELRLARMAINEFLPTITDNTAKINEYTVLILEWKPGTTENPIPYAIGDLRKENGAPYKCTQAHTHHGEEGWNPASGSALWRRYHGTSKEAAWEFTADGANPYLQGEYCIENDACYRCIADSTVYAPSAYPAHWEEA